MDMVHNNPGEKPYDTKYNDPNYLKSQGFNSMVLLCQINTAITYDNYKKNSLLPGSDERNWIEAKAKIIDPKLAACKQAGLNAFAFTDFLVFPKTIWEQYGKQLIEENDTNFNSHKPDINRSLTQQLLIAQIEGIFNRFPNLDGIVLRFGETYLHDTPFHFGSSPISNDDSKSIKDHILLINILRNEICVKRNKKLFYRTWDFGYRFHNNPAYYLAVTNAIEPHPNLFFSIKYQQGDFYRMVNFNPCIGIGKHRQIIESQSRLEVYGKGAHPYYTGSGVICGWPENKFDFNWWNNSYTGKEMPAGSPRGVKDVLEKGLLAGICTWSNGGGWQGPYIKHEIWTDLNTYVVSHWAQNTSKTEEELFNTFASTLGLSGNNIKLFRQIAELSIEAVRKGQMSDYTENAVWWARDEFFSVNYNQVILKTIIAKNLQQKVLQEKTEACAMWLQIEALSRQLDMTDSETLEAILTSCSYGRIKYQLIEQMWILMIEDASYTINKKLNKQIVSNALKRYDELWVEWRNLEKSNKYCASLYTDKAFRNERKGSIGELVDEMRELNLETKN